MKTELLAYFDAQIDDARAALGEADPILTSVSHELDVGVDVALGYLSDLSSILKRVMARVDTLQEQLMRLRKEESGEGSSIEVDEPDEDMALRRLLEARENTERAARVLARVIAAYGNSNSKRARELLAEGTSMLFDACLGILVACDKDSRLSRA